MPVAKTSLGDGRALAPAACDDDNDLAELAMAALFLESCGRAAPTMRVKSFLRNMRYHVGKPEQTRQTKVNNVLGLSCQ